MINVARMTILILPLLAACATVGGPPPALGESIAGVEARFGPPTAVYPDGAGKVLEYATGPMGQRTYMARFGPDGRLVSYQQVLTSPVFGSLKIGEATKADVLRTVGRPAEVSHVALNNYEVWSYRYKEDDVWNSMMHLHFDQAGVLRLMQNGPDPMYEERRFFR
jgi:hypothetical protein